MLSQWYIIVISLQDPVGIADVLGFSSVREDWAEEPWTVANAIR